MNNLLEEVIDAVDSFLVLRALDSKPPLSVRTTQIHQNTHHVYLVQDNSIFKFRVAVRVETNVGKMYMRVDEYELGFIDFPYVYPQLKNYTIKDDGDPGERVLYYEVNNVIEIISFLREIEDILWK